MPIRKFFRCRNSAPVVLFSLFLIVTFSVAGLTANSAEKSGEDLSDKGMLETSHVKRSAHSPLLVLSPDPLPTPEIPHNLVAFYDTENFASARLLLNNKGLETIFVRPTLYNLDGLVFEVPPVPVEGSSFRMIDLNDWAAAAGPGFKKGSVKLFHTGKDLVLGTQIYLEKHNGIAFEERLAELGKFDSRRLDAIWWMPGNQTDVRIILSNTSVEVLSITAALSRKPNHTGVRQVFVLQPHQTRLLDLKTDFIDGDQFSNSEIVALTLEHSGEKGALKAHGQIKDESVGYSSVISFTNPASGKSNELHGTGLHLGGTGPDELEPVVIVKNAGTESANVTAKVPYSRPDGSTGNIDINSLNLSPGEMRSLNMNAAANRARHENIETAGLEVMYDSAPGGVIVNVQSVSRDRENVYRVPMGDPFAQTSATGGYPWRIESGSRTYAYIKNMSDLEQDYIAYLTWAEGGRYMLGLKNLAPHASTEIDVEKLRDQQTPDINGNTIPQNISGGQIQWSLRKQYQTGNRKTDELALIGRSEQVDVAGGISSSYACQNCCAQQTVGFIEPIDADGEIGDTVQFNAYESVYSCYGAYSGTYPKQVSTWSSNATSIAAIDSSGLATITGAGTTSISAYWFAINGVENAPCGGGGPVFFSGGEDGGKNDCKPPDTTASLAPCGGCSYDHRIITPDQLIKGKAKITDLDPEQSVVNREVLVTIHGKGFTPDSIITITGTGVTYHDPMVISDKKITATFSVAANAAQGDRDIFVTAGGIPTNAKKFKIQIPYQLQVVDDTGQEAFANCSYTWGRRITYRFVDSNGDEIKEPIHFMEAFDNQTTNSCGNGQPIAYPQSFLKTFEDSIAITANCSSPVALSSCRKNGSCGYQHTQKWLTWGHDGNIQLTSVLGITHCNEVRVNGSLQFTSGTILPK